jgi:DNA-directed RNA polymerase, mitochondrial
MVMTTTTINPITPEADLYAQQATLESEMTMLGIERMRAIVARAKEYGREDETVYGSALVGGLLDKVTTGIREFIATRESGKAGRKGPAYRYLKMWGDNLDVLAFIALRVIVSGLTNRPRTLSTVAGRIGRLVEDELRYTSIRVADQKFYEQLRHEADKRVGLKTKQTVVNLYVARRGGFDAEPWPEKDVLLVGMLLVEIVIQHTGMIAATSTQATAKTTETLIVPTDETRTFAEQRIALAELMRPTYEPMIVPPIDWTTPFNGGYLTRRVKPLRLVKTHSRDYLESLSGHLLDDVMEAVNIAQATAWTINPFILTILEMAWERDYSLGGVPMVGDPPLPPKPHDIETNEEARIEWRRAAHAVYRERIEVSTRRWAFTTTLNTARRYSLFPAIYFPHQLDFRGRLYAAPQLNPQGPDYMKALLQFSEGKPIDEESAPFLAIHLANTGAFGKIDKAPLEDRVAWVYENQEAILACAADPFNNRWWTEADSPYCFLAACREWAGWVETGPGFVSHLPVALDGACSGVQHFSMALADEVGGAAVNLVPSDKPADLYSLVLDKVVDDLKETAEGDEEEDAEVARQWLQSGLLNRSLVKRPTMTFGYGSGLSGFRSQIAMDTLRPTHRAYLKGEAAWPFEGDGHKAALFLARGVLSAVEGTVLKAAEAMKWLKAAAAVVTTEGLPVRWTTPDGFIVVQQYREMEGHRIDTVLLGVRRTATAAAPTQKVDRRKQATSFPPNFVHSLDATHMRLSVRRAAAEGITSFALIHDSFGTHVADTPRFFPILRETMVEMYRDKGTFPRLFDELRGQLSAKNMDKLPPIPALGNLDIEAVIDCDFAFA